MPTTPPTAVARAMSRYPRTQGELRAVQTFPKHAAAELGQTWKLIHRLHKPLKLGRE